MPCRSRSRSRSQRSRLSAPAEAERVPPRRPRIILVGSVIYLALIFGVMLWRGISIEPQWVVIALLVIDVSFGRSRSFNVIYAPLLLHFFTYADLTCFVATK